MSACNHIQRATAYLRQALLAGAGGLVLLFGQASEGNAQPPKQGNSRTVRGTVERFTMARKGEVDGCVLTDDTWVHWPPHLGARVSPLLARGDRIRVTGRTEIGKKGETRFEAALIVNLRTDRSIALGDDDGPDFGTKDSKGKGKGKKRKGKDKGPREAVGEVTVLRGVVGRFTTAPRGEVDGFMLDDGTWIHWPPHLGEQVKGLLSKGDRVRVSGQMVTGRKGDSKFEARSLTNLRNEKSVLFDERAEPLRAPRGAAATDRAERLRTLEQRLDDLTREIKELRRER